MRVLSITSLFPNAVMPNHGIFVENRLRHLAASGRVDLRVVAPVPWFPIRSPAFGRYAGYARVPAQETRYGLTVAHPRYLVIPKVGMNVAPHLLYACLRAHVGRQLADGEDVDVIDAHYFYPDGVAAAWLGRRLGRPVVITGRGSDLHTIPRFAGPRRLIRRAAQTAAAVITVSEALKAPLVDLGLPAERVRVLRNGVDLQLFRPADRPAARAKLGLRRSTIISVGNLIPLKGHDLIIRALPLLEDVDLVIVGDGPEKEKLKALAHELGVGDRTRFLGILPHAELPRIYLAADALVLASAREGWPNVLLEAMACGTPVAAACTGGIPEVVAAPEAGCLFSDRTPQAIADAVGRIVRNPPDREATRRYAENFSWEATTAGQLELFREVLAR